MSTKGDCRILYAFYYVKLAAKELSAIRVLLELEFPVCPCRVLQQAFVDMEHMFEMIEREPDVQDVPEAKQLSINKGGIRFDNVGFEYIEG